MNAWAVLSVALGAFVVASLLIGIALARIFHVVAEASALLEDEYWLSAPLSQEYFPSRTMG